MVSTFVSIPGYRISEELYNGSRTLVYRGYRETDSIPVVIKLLKNPYPSFSELLSFRNQYTIAKNLNSELIVQSYSLQAYQNGYALVMEDFGGISLKEWEVSQSRQSLQEFLEIAIALCDTLNLLYHERIIHKDIKPANILINPETKQVKLIDFSIASLLPRETQTLINPNILEGTLAYISPEQTGRMNRGIDYRTDLYSLGVTFYELLTGELPFNSNDPMELVHSHIAKQPNRFKIQNDARGHGLAALTKFNNEEIPQVLCDIVMKLMAKNAEDRYQSALGLKFDLENCLHQLQVSGEIHKFEIAQRDVCDRFIIPEKLYGRESEVETLLEAFERVSNSTSEMMLVAGFSGIGKTAVVNEVHKPIVKQRGYFVKGKFDQFNRNIPFSAFVQAFRDLMGQLLSESDQQLQTWKTQILQAVGENGQVIIEVIPELERIIGQQPTATELSGTAAQNRFNLLFQNFIKVFTTKEHPLVMFLDDLQWADSASLNLMQLLMSGLETGYLLLIGAYRDNEVSPVHPLMLTVDAVVKAGANVNTITLQPLSQSSLNHLVADTLNCTEILAKPLTDSIGQKTGGNPFFATQFLKALHQDGLIEFDPPQSPLTKGGRKGGWQCDIVRVRDAALTDDVVEFMALQLQKLPSATQDILKLAACIGNLFDLSTLAMVSEQSETEAATALWKSLQEGLILPQSETYKFFQSHAESDQRNNHRDIAVPYKFLHDRVQQAAYSLIPEDQKTATHLKIGQLLQENSSEIELEEKLFDIANHLNIGKSLITQPSERTELAQLNLAAGRKAKLATAYSAAIAYSTIGIELLGQYCWESHYELTLALHDATAEAAYLSGQFAQMEAIADLTLKSAKTLLDKIPTYETQIQAYLAQNRLTEAIQTALNILKQLGIKLPQNPTTVELLLGLAKTQLILGRKKLSDLLNLPTMSHPEKLATMRILASATGAALVSTPKLSSLLGFQQVNLSVQYGNLPLSAYAYSCHGTFFCGVLFNIDQGYEFGQLALQILEKFNAKDMRSKVLVVVHGFILHWKQHLRSTLSALQEAYQIGLETGNLENSAWAAILQIGHLYIAGQELSNLEKTLHYYGEAVEQLKQHVPLVYINIHHQAVLNLMGESSNPSRLDGSVYSETQNAIQEASGDRTGLLTYYIIQTGLSYLFGDFSNAVKQAIVAKKYEGAGISLAINVPFCLYDSLARLALYPTATKTERSQILRHITQNQKRLQKWASFAPMNCLHKFHLVEAERYRVLLKLTKAIEMYDRAIALAKANEYIQEEALANELAAKFYLDWGKEKVAAGYMQEAYYCYARWGAKAKTDDLETRYPDLLRPILQQATQQMGVNLLDPIASISTFHASLSSPTNTTRSSDTLNTALDFAAILKASQALSSTIELDDLLHQLTKIILQNSGGDRCVLILPSEHGEWQVRAIANLEETILVSIPLENNLTVPVKLIQYVKNTLETVVIDNLKTDPLGLIDEYPNQHQSQSVLCLPILNQGNLGGILYLENGSVSGAFTKNRLLALKFLATQAAISLENARLYERVQKTLDELQQAQLQIVQSEKMSALGNLVAGVAHEINNPVGCIIGNVGAVEYSINDLFGLIDLYGEELPQPSAKIKAEIKAIDLEYLRSDLPKLIKAMKDAGDRITSISKSLRTFSRADSDKKQKFNVHEGIDSTVLILRHRLKANEHRPAIEVVTDYGQIPDIACFPGQLNQVFMNIIANAIDALDESNLGRSFADIQANPHRITIQTRVEGDRLKIAIADNGPGMPETVKTRIFDHLFTTKAVGKGTGLGLAIARQIVEETHDGAIAVESAINEGTKFIISLPL